MSTHTGEMEKDAALKIVEKKLKALKKYPENIIRRRLWGMLKRRGFSSDTINMAVRSVSNKKS
ncbi:MAG: RecX family transcriptional regulator [Candidatus Mariimomonas ferrooxydans]